MLSLFLTALVARADVQGLRTDFRSPNGVTESCVALTHMPGVKYSAKDEEAERSFCAIDLYDNAVAICAKTWSTSPGTMIYSTKGLSQAQYEATRCAGKAGHTKLAKFKNTMNAQETSSTFSTSSLLYYHFSRYFDTSLSVPPAVYRTIDKNQHFARVTSRANGVGRMNKAAWEIMRDAEINPASYVPTDELFTADRQSVFGIMMKDKGNPYGAEVEGTEQSPWGVGQNNDFQKTPGFYALRSSAPLAQAIQEGVANANQDPIMKKAVGVVSAVQVAYWMKEIDEITLLDFIFSQQDRIMNIDFKWEWTYVDPATASVKDAKVVDPYSDYQRPKMSRIPTPPELAAYKPLLLQRTVLNDNDAGGRVQYTNFTKKTQMLEKIRHYNGDLYRKLTALDRDFASRGAVYQHVATTFGLNAKQLTQITTNTSLALGILRQTCRAGQMNFDVQPKRFMLGQPTAEAIDCENP